MKKTDRILQFLAECKGPQTTSEVAAGIDEADDTKGVGGLLSYLAGQRGFVAGARASDTSPEKAWTITAAGRQWFDELAEECDAAEPAKKIVHEAARAKATKARIERAADPEKLAPLPRKKPKPAPPVLQPTAIVEQTPLPPAIGRQIAIRDDGAVLLLEGDLVVTTLVPEDALRIARVIQTLSGVRA